MNKLISDITDFIFIEDEPCGSDVIIAVGGSDPSIPEKAAELYAKKYAPYVIATGKYSVKLGHFKGVRRKADIYSGDYETECDFYCDVLHRCNVPQNAVIREDKSEFTRQNAEFARTAADEKGIPYGKILVVCKKYHARRCKMFFSSAFPESEIRIAAVDACDNELDITRDNWYKSEKGIKRVMGELARCGEQFDCHDILKWK